MVMMDSTVVLSFLMFLLVEGAVSCLDAFQSMLTKTRVGGWATSNNDLSNHNMRIDVTLLEDRRAVINNSIHKKIKQLQGISAYCRFNMLKYCYLRLP